MAVLSCRRPALYTQEGRPDGMLTWMRWWMEVGKEGWEDTASQWIVTDDDLPQEFNTSAIDERRNCQRLATIAW